MTILHPQGVKPFQIFEKTNDNAYKVDRPCEYNVSDLTLFDVGSDSRLDPFKEEE